MSGRKIFARCVFSYYAVHLRAQFTHFSIEYMIAALGVVAQLGERRVRNAKVGSSILLDSTIPLANSSSHS